MNLQELETLNLVGQQENQNGNIVLDVSSVSDFELLEDGEYILRIKQAENKISQAGNKYLKLTLESVYTSLLNYTNDSDLDLSATTDLNLHSDSNSDGILLWHNLMLTNKKIPVQIQRQFLRSMGYTTEQLSKPVILSPNLLIDKLVFAKVKIKQGNDKYPQPSNEIHYFMNFPPELEYLRKQTSLTLS